MPKDNDSKGGFGLEIIALFVWIGVLFVSPFTPNRARHTIRALLVCGAVLLGGLLTYGVHDTAVKIYHLQSENGAFVVALLAFPVTMMFIPYLVIRDIWGEQFFNNLPNLKVIQYLLCFAFYSSIINFLIVQLPK